MISTIWFILSLFRVCSFTWLPVFLETLLISVQLIRKNGSSRNFSPHGTYDTTSDFCIAVLTFICVYAFYKHFLHLGGPLWWIVFSPVYTLAVILIPGSMILVNHLLAEHHLIDLPQWAFALSIILSFCSCCSLRYIINDHRRFKKIHSAHK